MGRHVEGCPRWVSLTNAEWRRVVPAPHSPRHAGDVSMTLGESEEMDWLPLWAPADTQPTIGACSGS